MTLEESRNLHQSLPSASFSGSYLTNTNQINSSYNQNSQNPTNYPPLFHPAAVAAVAAAAAAAGYTQQFNPGVVSITFYKLLYSGLINEEIIGYCCF